MSTHQEGDKTDIRHGTKLKKKSPLGKFSSTQGPVFHMPWLGYDPCVTT